MTTSQAARRATVASTVGEGRLIRPGVSQRVTGVSGAIDA
jgi:hypothetical protein